MGFDASNTRVFDSPPELIRKAWTEPEMFKKRRGPKKFTFPAGEIDFSVGGVCHSIYEPESGKGHECNAANEENRHSSVEASV
jgi:uncharacterized protein YndB with AHSA1/START domain